MEKLTHQFTLSVHLGGVHFVPNWSVLECVELKRLGEHIAGRGEVDNTGFAVG